MERKSQKEESGRKFPTLMKWDQIRWIEGKKEGKKTKIKENKEEGKWSEKLYLLSKIYGDRVVGFHRGKRKSSSTRLELRVGTKI